MDKENREFSMQSQVIWKLLLSKAKFEAGIPDLK